MLIYAEALATEPCRIAEKHIKHLREVGFDDEAILDINLISSYFSFVNRLSCGLGVELEDYLVNSK